MVQSRFGYELASPVLGSPGQEDGQTTHTAFPRRVLDRAAVAARLQREASFGRSGSQAQSYSASRSGRQRWKPCPEYRVFFLHAFERTTAPEPNPRSKLIMPKPLTRPSFASLTCRPSALPLSWRIASVTPRKPPAAPACPTESWPPEVLSGKSPSCVSPCARTNAAPSPFAQKPRSSICIIGIT